MTPGATILVTGATGFLGRYLVDEIKRRDQRALTAGRGPTALFLDLEKVQTIGTLVQRARPDVVIHAAAMSSVGQCESEPARATLVNHQATAYLAEAMGGSIVYVSTDLVFDGTRAPYRAEDPPAPISVYGTSKAEAESATVASGGIVARVPLLFGRSFDGRRGATDMIRHARTTGAELRLFTNERRTPLHAADAARGLVDLALERPGAGVTHLAGPESVSRFDLGQRFLAAAAIDDVIIEAAESEDPLRPRDVSLSTDWDCGRSLDAALAEC